MRVYNTFEEINKDLSVLKLERQIALEKVKLNVAKTKTELQPTQLLGGFSGILRKTLLTLLIKKFVK